MKEKGKKTDFENIKNDVMSLYNMFVKHAKGVEILDEKQSKDVLNAINSGRNIMKELNVKENLNKNERALNFVIFNEIANDNDRKKLRDVLKVDISKIQLLQE